MINSISLASVALGVANLVHVATAQDPSYSLVFNHQGANFFNNWNFYNGWDVNNTGTVEFQTQDASQQLGLTSLNSAGNTIIKVDNTTSGVGNASFLRPSVKILTDYTISSGNLLLFDAVHMPFGCSVWPAFWSQGPAWPDDGEIDIMEGVNLQVKNDISLHTLDGCTHPAAGVQSFETGNLISTDCFNQTDFNQGCIVEVATAGYGADFASAGGGVYAMLWNDTGLTFWFFQRGSIPADLPTDSPNPAGWGNPTAYYPQTSCNFNTFFKPQTFIIDITLCGNFAGQPNVFSQTCSGTCLDLVPIPTNFDDAYFEISYMRVFQQTNGSAPSTSPAGTALSTGAGGSGGGTVTVTDSSASAGSTAPAGTKSGAATTSVSALTLVACVLLEIVAVGFAQGFRF